jgi:hypothetical protein
MLAVVGRQTKTGETNSLRQQPLFPSRGLRSHPDRPKKSLSERLDAHGQP